MILRVTRQEKLSGDVRFGWLLFQKNIQRVLAEFDDVAGKNFFTLLRLNFAIEPNLTILNDHLSLAARAYQAFKFENLEQLNGLSIDFYYARFCDVMCSRSVNCETEYGIENDFATELTRAMQPRAHHWSLRAPPA